MAQKFCLQWNDFKENVHSAFGRLRDDKEFADVTLACEDGQQIEAHKVILAASSTFFENLLRKNRHVHPLIYLRGVTLSDMVAIVDFLYFGETSIWKENLESFLNIAEDFKLKGLTSENEAKENENVLTESIVTENIFTENQPKIKPKKLKKERSEHSDLTSSTGFDTLAVPTYFEKELLEYDQKVRSMMQKTDNWRETRLGKKEKSRVCKGCGKEGRGSNITDHIENNHMEGFRIPCKFCEMIFETRTYLCWPHLYYSMVKYVLE